jgi:hypothetical protein
MGTRSVRGGTAANFRRDAGARFWYASLASFSVALSACNEDTPPEDSGGGGEGGEVERGVGGDGGSTSPSGGKGNVHASGGATGGKTNGEVDGGAASTGGVYAAGGIEAAGGTPSGGSAGEPSSGGGEPDETGGSGAGGSGGCDDGYFLDSDACRPWSDCTPGSYVAGLPSFSNDRFCIPCSEGSYASDPNQPYCLPNGCEVTEVTLTTGSSIAHAECSPRPTALLSRDAPIPVAVSSGQVVSVLVPKEASFEVLELGAGARSTRNLDTPVGLSPLALIAEPSGDVFLASRGAGDSAQSPLAASVRSYRLDGSAAWTLEWLPETATYEGLALGADALFAQGTTLSTFSPEIPFGFVQRLTKSGSVEWTHKFEHPYGANTTSIQLGSEGALYVGGFQGVEYFVASLSSENGSEQWRVPLSRTVEALALADDGGVVVLALGPYGELQVISLDAAGEPRWTWTDDPQQFGLPTAKSLLALKDGTYAIGAEFLGPNNQQDIVVLRVSSEGLRLGSQILGGPHGDVLVGLAETDAGEVFAIGSTDLGTDIDRIRDSFVLRLDVQSDWVVVD